MLYDKSSGKSGLKFPVYTVTSIIYNFCEKCLRKAFPALGVDGKCVFTGGSGKKKQREWDVKKKIKSVI